MKVFAAFALALFASFALAAVYPPEVAQQAATAQLWNQGRHGPCKITSATVGASALTLTDGGVPFRSSVSIQNQTAATVLYCTFDGLTTPTTSLGVRINPDALYSDNLSGEINVRCVSTGTSVVSIQECK